VAAMINIATRLRIRFLSSILPTYTASPIDPIGSLL
jgi:hypothetical protein